MRDYLAIAAPLLLHMLVSEAVPILAAALGVTGADSAWMTTMTALAVLPFAYKMYCADRKRGCCAAPERTPQTAPQGTPERTPQTVRLPRLAALALCFVAGGILNLAWSRVLAWLRLTEHFSNQVQEQLFASTVLVQILGLGILVPVAEELIFRVLIYTRMKRILSVRQSVFFSALLFAVYHGNLVQMIFAFPLALVLALLYERGRFAGYPIAFHIGANLTAVLVNFLLA